jgi:hypothetical protein
MYQGFLYSCTGIFMDHVEFPKGWMPYQRPMLKGVSLTKPELEVRSEGSASGLKSYHLLFEYNHTI